MELNREGCISELDTKIKYAKFANTNAVVLSSKAAQFCLERAQYYEQKIKELTEENERLRTKGEWIDTGDEELDKIYSGYKCSVCGFVICGHSGKYCSECGAKMKGE